MLSQFQKHESKFAAFALLANRLAGMDVNPTQLLNVPEKLTASALLANSDDSNELKLFEYVNTNIITPLYSSEILLEYKEVLSRKEFGFTKKGVGDLISRFKK